MLKPCLKKVAPDVLFGVTDFNLDLAMRLRPVRRGSVVDPLVEFSHSLELLRPIRKDGLDGR